MKTPWKIALVLTFAGLVALAAVPRRPMPAVAEASAPASVMRSGSERLDWRAFTFRDTRDDAGTLRTVGANIALTSEELASPQKAALAQRVLEEKLQLAARSVEHTSRSGPLAAANAQRADEARVTEDLMRARIRQTAAEDLTRARQMALPVQPMAGLEPAAPELRRAQQEVRRLEDERQRLTVEPASSGSLHLTAPMQPRSGR